MGWDFYLFITCWDQTLLLINLLDKMMQGHATGS